MHTEIYSASDTYDAYKESRYLADEVTTKNSFALLGGNLKLRLLCRYIRICDFNFYIAPMLGFFRHKANQSFGCAGDKLIQAT